MSTKKSHRKIVIIGIIAVVIMFTFCFAMARYYGLICKQIGINDSAPDSGLLTPLSKEAQAAQKVDLTREVTVQFVAIDHMGLPWDFYPKTKSIRVHPGQNAKVFFYAKNTTDKEMTVQAIPSLTPSESIGHLHKIECFCFRNQTLRAHESKDMPLIFNIDNELPKETHIITLAYTLFPVKPKKN